MRAYIIYEGDSVEVQKDITSWLPEDSDVKIFDNATNALEDIKTFSKPCIVFIQLSKIQINGIDFISYAKREMVCTYIFAICDGESSHDKIREMFGLDSEEIICDKRICPVAAAGKTCTNRNKMTIEATGNRIKMLSEISSSVREITIKIETMKRRAILWSQKLQMSSL